MQLNLNKLTIPDSQTKSLYKFARV